MVDSLGSLGKVLLPSLNFTSFYFRNENSLRKIKITKDDEELRDVKVLEFSKKKEDIRDALIDFENSVFYSLTVDGTLSARSLENNGKSDSRKDQKISVWKLAKLSKKKKWIFTALCLSRNLQIIAVSSTSQLKADKSTHALSFFEIKEENNYKLKFSTTFKLNTAWKGSKFLD